MLAVLLLTLLIESWEDIRSEGMAVYLRESLAILFTVLLFVALLVYLSNRTEKLNKYVSNKG